MSWGDDGSRSHQRIEVSVVIKAETDLAYGVEDDTVEGKLIWLPKSLAKITRRQGNVAEIDVPEWLANREGLI